ncbi:hypothetical protein Pcinc_010174 [Petrolisthes cinctipes]|uniref:Uncharacterized protein n=1 Tax=Petrolisthes cinctipes TaxID=88211 RepID=A0AAE1G3L9_PETCI|nr:hypothetical protein Pcinc_010174 [Petrolisthes cinctipes]
MGEAGMGEEGTVPAEEGKFSYLPMPREGKLIPCVSEACASALLLDPLGLYSEERWARPEVLLLVRPPGLSYHMAYDDGTYTQLHI